MAMKGKGRIRSLNRRGTRSAKGPLVARKTRTAPGPTVCHRCGSTFVNKTWRRNHRLRLDSFDRARWIVCPACKQERHAEGFGKIVLRGAYVAAHEEAIRRRIENVAARAEFTQPQRRVVAITRERDGLEILTTSQKLTHRIARELKKAFGGRTSYAWSDRDGALFATWDRADAPAPKSARRRRRTGRAGA